MRKMLYVPIDFVGSDERAQCFLEELAPSLVRAQSSIRDNHYPIHLGLKTTLIRGSQHGWGVSETGEEMMYEGFRMISGEGIDYWVEMWPSGPTRSMFGVLFDQGAIVKGFSSISTGDLDNTPPDKNLEKFLELEERVKVNNRVLGVGSRNKKIVLAYNETNGYLRRIMEGIYNLAVRSAAEISGNEILEKGDNLQDPAFTAHGDFITGIYLFNPGAPEALNFSAEVINTARKNEFSGFEDEYFMTIKGGETGLVSGVFETTLNLYDPVNEDEERRNIVSKQIKAPLQKLSKTKMIRYLKKADFRVLEEFYDSDQIREVLGYMGLNGQ